MKEIIIKKPQQKRSRAKFQAILDSCPRVLGHYGYPKTTAAKIAVEAEVGIGTFYDYFSCKEAVFIAYLDQQLNRALEDVSRRAGDKEAMARDILRALMQTGVDFAHQHREVIKLVFTHFPLELHLINLEDSRKKLETIAMDFTANHKPTMLRRDPALTLYILTNLVLGFQFRIVVMPEENFDREAVVEELTNIVYSYLFD